MNTLKSNDKKVARLSTEDPGKELPSKPPSVLAVACQQQQPRHCHEHPDACNCEDIIFGKML